LEESFETELRSDEKLEFSAEGEVLNASLFRASLEKRAAGLVDLPLFFPMTGEQLRA